MAWIRYMFAGVILAGIMAAPAQVFAQCDIIGSGCANNPRCATCHSGFYTIYDCDGSIILVTDGCCSCT